jgi:hypothetical protein
MLIQTADRPPSLQQQQQQPGGLAAWHAGPARAAAPLAAPPGGEAGLVRGGRNGSIPGPLSLRSGLAAARTGRQGSLPGPAHVPPQPGVAVPYRFEVCAVRGPRTCAWPRPTQPCTPRRAIARSPPACRTHAHAMPAP